MRRALGVAALVETVSLLVLFGNLATTHSDALTSLLGPLHGTAYLATIALTFMSTRSGRPRLLSVVPGVGGLLANRAIRRRSPPSKPATDRSHPVEPTGRKDIE